MESGSITSHPEQQVKSQRPPSPSDLELPKIPHLTPPPPTTFAHLKNTDVIIHFSAAAFAVRGAVQVLRHTLHSTPPPCPPPLDQHSILMIPR